MKFYVEVYESSTDKLCEEFDKEFANEEEAEVWCSENYNGDTYAFATRNERI